MTAAHRTKPKLVVPAHLQERQRTASDPRLSIWVSANAGSGKTHVLTQRVIRLLLDGVPPAKILCLTFTKAAAAQMSTRVFDALAKWTTLEDGKLRAAIEATGAPTPTPAMLTRARRLFTRTVETPGGLKIQTIHAFCERLLHLFPFEANVPARFEVADERRTEEMLALARHGAIAALRDSPALGVVADIAGSFGLNDLLAEAMKPRAVARRAATDPQARLAERLGADRRAPAQIRHAMLHDGLAPQDWPRLAMLLETGGAGDRKHAESLRTAHAALPAAAPREVEALDAYLGIFFTGEGKPRKILVTRSLAKTHPDLAESFADEQTRLAALQAALATAQTLERTQSLIDLVDHVLDRYDGAKAAAGVLDFDDLIERTLALLENAGSGWVLHKLDAGIDHVLVDEAQDTSDAQWKILERLTADFAAGETARSGDRSFFVVGDDKQSIFSFQGAAPLKFEEMRQRFERRFRSGGKPFERVALKTSFRSVPGVLDAVDKIFASKAHQDGLVQGEDVWPLHESIKSRLPGLVEIWPRLKAEAAPDPADWSIPVDAMAETDPASQVADRVARKVHALIAPGSPDRVHDERSEVQRPVRPGDILVLVRTRGPFFEAVIRALKHHDVPVAGADRLDVANHIAVMDLVAAGRAALLPQDDLSLACVLKSPLFGLTDDDLIALAPERRGTLFEALAASPQAAHREAHASLARWAERASVATPFAFYVELLGRDGGRRRMEQRLGPEAHDAIDEFLQLALAHEQMGAPALGAFLTDVEALESSIRRDMEAAGDTVRVMTVHAAKGLEAKIVFLPDTCAVPALALEPRIFDLDKDSGAPPLLVWSPRKGDDPPVVSLARAAERTATLREYRRLLYVALTRAEERLYIAGFFASREPPEDCWGAMIDRTFPDAEEVEAPWPGEDKVRRIVAPGTAPVETTSAATKPSQGDLGLPPDWLSRPVGDAMPSAPLRPSKLRGAEPSIATAREGRAYGTALHLLLQHLPGAPPERRREAAAAALAGLGDALPAKLRDALLEEATRVLALSELAPLFGPEARAEVAVAGSLPRAGGGVRPVRGIVDRLAVLADRVVIADFKSGASVAPPPRGYIEQLALYRRVLAPLWPAKPIEALLVWTQAPEVVPLANDELDAVAAALLASA